MPEILSRETARVLRHTPRRSWRFYALLYDADGGTARIVSRGELVAMLRSDALYDLARDAATRQVPAGSILALQMSDVAGTSVEVVMP
jgi:hypothetical protein